MKKLIIALALLPLLVFNCHEKTNSNETSENVLLAKEVTVTSPHIIDNEQNPDWTASFDHKAFFDSLFTRAVNNKIKVYVIRSADFEDVELAEEMLKDEIIAKTSLKIEGGIIKSVKEILFYERWNFNNKSFKFSKEIIGWCPITNWKQDGVEKRQKVFYIYPKINTKGIKIAERIIYEIPWYYDYPTTNVGFDKKAFFRYLINGIKAGTIDAWDPIYLVDKSKRKFKPDELANYIGQELNPGKIEFSLGSILFEEDWYFDENTLSIQKEVKSFAFVQDRYDPEKGVSEKKILFFIFPK
jgi:hypothetical protein